MKLSEYMFTFLMGYFIYSMFEIVSRGYTHWTMALTGGTVLTLIYAVNRKYALSLVRSCIAGTLMILSVEFTVGVFDNIIMGWQVWDYSDVPLNVMGQICLPYAGVWFIMCIPAYYLCRAVRRRFRSPDHAAH